MCLINCSGGCPECAPEDHYFDCRAQYLSDEIFVLLLRIRKRLKRSRMADAKMLIEEIEQMTQKIVASPQSQSLSASSGASKDTHRLSSPFETLTTSPDRGVKG